MKKCENCSMEFDDNFEFCTSCGAKLETMKEADEKNEATKLEADKKSTFCSHCGKPLESKSPFCPNCGATLDASSKNSKNIVEKAKDNAFVKSVASDVKNSQAIGIIKDKASAVKKSASSMDAEKKKKIKITAVIAAVVIILIMLVTNIHTCSECDKKYIGKKYVVNFFGYKEEVCKDCYEDYYGW